LVSQFISNYVSNNNPNPPQEPAGPTSSLSEGHKLAGCYALTRRLLSGGATEIWLATDEVLGKDVTLHFIPSAIRKDGRAIQELRLDIKRNRQLIHPHILRVYDLVEESERVAISMDVFEAESLAEQIKEGKAKKPAEIQAWVEQLAKTLEEAHKINVIHRDLNPGNLMLTSQGKLLVTNFGIGRTIRDAQARSSGGAAAVTGFESPQALDGAPGARTDDVYSFGAVLYAALTGQAPFAGENLGEQVRAGVSPAALERLSDEALGLPVSWRTTIAACLAKNPEDRPQTVAEAWRRLTMATEEASAAVPARPVAAPVDKLVVSEPVAAVVVEAAEPVAPVQLELEKSEPEKPEAVQAEPEKLEPAKPAEPNAEPSAPEPAQKDPVIFEPLKSEIVPRSGPEPAPSTLTEPAARETRETPKQSEVVKPYTAPPAPPSKPFERQLSKEFLPKLYPEESRFPTKPLAAAAVMIVLGIIYFVVKKPASEPADSTPEKAELRALTTPAASPGSAASPVPVIAAVPTPAPAGTPKVETSVPPAATPPAQVPAEKNVALEKAKVAAQTAEQEYAALLKQKEAAETAVADMEKTVAEKVKAAEPLKKAVDEVVAGRKKLEEEQKMAEAAAAEAQKIAAEKAQAAEAAKKSLEGLEKMNAEKMVAQQKAEAEIAAIQKTLAEKQQAAAESAKALTEAQAAKEQKNAAIAEQEREMERMKTVDTAAQAKREAEEAERRKVEQELAEMKKLFSDRMKELENKRKALETPGTAAPLPDKVPVPPPPVVPSVKTGLAPLPKAGTPEPVKMASTPATPTPLPGATPTPVVVAGGNSLGIKFVPVGDVEFAIWQTRVKDFEAFAKAVNLRSNSWKGPGFKQGPDHPVVNVSWQEAIAFCKWLTDKEHKENILPANQYYRLPSDLEWSKAVGLAEETGKTPEARDMGVQDVYPWGTQWPPPAGAGNYTGEETGSDVAIKGYEDGFAWTSPVGSFPPNKLGLYDMGGNVWQWCMDNWTPESKAKVLRGASWYNGALKLSLLSSCRVHAAPDSSTDNYGFRIVRATEAAKPTRK
jgi:serine/threonine protein kinase